MQNFKTILIVIAMAALAFACDKEEELLPNTMKDSRDGKIYSTVTIGTQTWMAENLAYNTRTGCMYYDDDLANLKKYGYLYVYEVAETACPQGWHLPSDKEWTTLEIALGLNPADSLEDYRGGEIFLNAKMNADYQSNNGKEYKNESGFSSLSGGMWDSYSEYGFKDDYAYYWTSTYWSGGLNHIRRLYDHNIAVQRSVSNITGSYWKSDALSIRCVKD